MKYNELVSTLSALIQTMSKEWGTDYYPLLAKFLPLTKSQQVIGQYMVSISICVTAEWLHVSRVTWQLSIKLFRVVCSVVKLTFPLQLWIKQTIARHEISLKCSGYWFVTFLTKHSVVHCGNCAPTSVLNFCSYYQWKENVIYSRWQSIHLQTVWWMFDLGLSRTSQSPPRALSRLAKREFSSTLQSSRKTKGSS